MTGEAGAYQFADVAARHLLGHLRAHRLHAAPARGHRRAGGADDAASMSSSASARCRKPSPSAASRRSSTSRTHGDPDQHHQGSLRGDSHRPQPVDDGRPRAGRRHRPARRRRHRGRAAVQHRGVRVGQQPEVVQHRRPQGELGRRRRRRHDDVLRLRDVRRIQHADGVGHRRKRCVRRLHEHGDQVGRQPLHLATTTSTS